MEIIDIPTPSIPVPGQGVTADRGAGDARAMRALRIIPGTGIRATSTPDGVVISADSVLRTAHVSSGQTLPWTVRVVEVSNPPEGMDGPVSIRYKVYVPEGAQMVVRNGARVAMDDDLTVDDGWIYDVVQLSGGDAADICVVIAQGGDSTASTWPQGNEEAMWTLLAEAPSDLNPTPALHAVIAQIDAAGVVRQYHTGTILSDWIETDEEESVIDGIPSTPASISRRDPSRDNWQYGSLEIFRFYDPEETVPGGDWEDGWPTDFTGALVLIRRENPDNGRIEVQYVPIGNFARSDGSGEGGGGESPPSWGPPSPDSDCSTTPNDPKHLYVWSSCTQSWVRLSAAAGAAAPLDARYWLLGGGAADCYGTAIGDSTKHSVINLSGKQLVGDWTANGSMFTAAGDVTIRGHLTLLGVEVGVQNVQSGNISGTIVANAGGIAAINDLKSRIAALEARLDAAGIS